MVAAAKKTPAKPAAEKKERKPRVPKPVTDLATANAAFQAAKRKAERATKAADAARQAEADANQALAAAAGVLKGYLGEVDAAVGNVLPQAEDDAPEVHPAEDDPEISGWVDTDTDAADEDDDFRA